MAAMECDSDPDLFAACQCDSDQELFATCLEVEQNELAAAKVHHPTQVPEIHEVRDSAGASSSAASTMELPANPGDTDEESCIFHIA